MKQSKEGGMQKKKKECMKMKMAQGKDLIRVADKESKCVTSYV